MELYVHSHHQVWKVQTSRAEMKVIHLYYQKLLQSKMKPQVTLK